MITLLANAGRGAWWLVLLAGASAFWLGAELIVLLFALASAAALAGFLRLDATDGGRLPLHTVCSFVCVPMQYAFIATGRVDLFIAALPLVGTLVIPLAMLAQRGTTRLLAGMSEQQIGVMVWVYLVSHAPALLMLDIPGFAAPNTRLVAFLVVVALASSSLRWLAFAPRASHRHVSKRASHGFAVRLAALGVVAGLGALLHWMTPFTPLVAASMALLIAVSSWLGCFAFVAFSPGGSAAWRRQSDDLIDGVAFPHALAFAAPVFFHAVRTWSAW